jgi:hypothetical protein
MFMEADRLVAAGLTVIPADDVELLVLDTEIVTAAPDAAAVGFSMA